VRHACPSSMQLNDFVAWSAIADSASQPVPCNVDNEKLYISFVLETQYLIQ